MPGGVTIMNFIELENRYSAKNYTPLPVVLTRGEGAYLWDTEGKRYIDMMSAYSAVSHGHGHPRILMALREQAQRLAVPSRAYYSDKLGPFLEELCRVTKLDAALPMNTGAEAVETAIKAARRFGYRVKGIRRDRAEIIVAQGNFHGRTSTIVGFSSEAAYRRGSDRADPGRGRHHRAGGRLSRRRAGAVRRAWRTHDPRRGAVGSRPHRSVVRVRAREYPPGRSRPR